MTSLEDLQLKFREVTVEKLKPGALLITTLTPQDGCHLEYPRNHRHPNNQAEEKIQYKKKIK